MISDKVAVGDLRDRPKHRSSYSTVEEGLPGGTVVMDGTALAVIDAFLSRNPISKAPRAAAIALAISSRDPELTSRASALCDAAFALALRSAI